jgi:hypothetical protein
MAIQRFNVVTESQKSFTIRASGLALCGHIKDILAELPHKPLGMVNILP